MIAAIDLSRPRKLTYNIINNFLFELKMSNGSLFRYKNSILLMLLCLVLYNEKTIALSMDKPQENLEAISVWDFIKSYDILLAYYTFELLKMKDVFIQYYLIKYKAKRASML